MNGDGVDDLIIGAPFANAGGRFWSGQSYVVFGRANSGFPAVLELSTQLAANGGDGSKGFALNGIDEDDISGTGVGAAGDVNGDGVDETYVVFGRSPGSESFPAQFRLSSLVPANGGDGSAGFILRGIKHGDESGYSVDGAGDLNGDGINDLVIGAYRGGPVDSYAGEAYVVFGKDGTTTFPALFQLGAVAAVHGQQPAACVASPIATRPALMRSTGRCCASARCTAARSGSRGLNSDIVGSDAHFFRLMDDLQEHADFRCEGETASRAWPLVMVSTCRARGRILVARPTRPWAKCNSGSGFFLM